MVTGELKAWLSVEETAELLGVHTNTVYTYLASKQINTGETTWPEVDNFAECCYSMA